jgi:putative PIN family toxin of toxin-antitoxin system
LAAARKFQLVVSDDILRELAGVLRRPKIGWSEARIDAAIGSLLRFSEKVRPEKRLSVVERDESDNRILECAEVGEADIVVTGDKHLLDLEAFGKIRIVTVRDFLGSTEKQKD